MKARFESDSQSDLTLDGVGVVDLFCGAGGLSHGFYRAGFDILAGYDVDATCKHAFEENNDSKFYAEDVAGLTATKLDETFGKARTRVLVGCAPCQPFSTYNQKNTDPKWSLVEKFGEIVVNTAPEIVSMENVPRLAKFRKGDVFERFVAMLKDADYYLDYDVIYGPDYGLPQTRSRLVLLASKLGPIVLPARTTDAPSDVRAAIGDLPNLEAGSTDPLDALHRSAALSPKNLERIRASTPGGTWRDWPNDLVTDCHKDKTGKGYVSVYGRMQWDEPSPTITTQFYGFGNGRFGHPEQDRALSLREGAILQGFPRDYEFFPDGEPLPTAKVGRLIGNAVPVTISEELAYAVRRHLQVADALGWRQTNEDSSNILEDITRT